MSNQCFGRKPLATFDREEAVGNKSRSLSFLSGTWLSTTLVFLNRQPKAFRFPATSAWSSLISLSPSRTTSPIRLLYFQIRAFLSLVVLSPSRCYRKRGPAYEHLTL